VAPVDSEDGQRLASFEEFWPFYLAQHSQRGCRILHYLGTSAALAIAVVALLSGHPRVLLLALLVGYAPAWIGHAFIEKNRPATFRYPFWSFFADFKMLFTALRDRRI
jgi:hypothetical protein